MAHILQIKVKILSTRPNWLVITTDKKGVKDTRQIHHEPDIAEMFKGSFAKEYEIIRSKILCKNKLDCFIYRVIDIIVSNIKISFFTSNLLAEIDSCAVLPQVI